MASECSSDGLDPALCTRTWSPNCTRASPFRHLTARGVFDAEKQNRFHLIKGSVAPRNMLPNALASPSIPLWHEASQRIDDFQQALPQITVVG